MYKCIFLCYIYNKGAMMCRLCNTIVSYIENESHPDRDKIHNFVNKHYYSYDGGTCVEVLKRSNCDNVVMLGEIGQWRVACYTELKGNPWVPAFLMADGDLDVAIVKEYDGLQTEDLLYTEVLGIPGVFAFIVAYESLLRSNDGITQNRMSLDSQDALANLFVAQMYNASKLLDKDYYLQRSLLQLCDHIEDLYKSDCLWMDFHDGNFLFDPVRGIPLFSDTF